MEEGIRVHHNLLERTGTKSDIYNKHRGSIDVETRYGDIKNVTIEDNVFVAPFDKGVTDHLNPNGGILNHVEVRNNQTIGQLSHPAQAGLSASASKAAGQALRVKEKPLQAGAVKASLQPSKVQPSKKQTGLNLKQAKTVTKTVKPNYVLKQQIPSKRAFKGSECFIPLPDDGVTSNGLRRMEILDIIPGFFACWSFIDSEKAYRYTRYNLMRRPP